MQTISDSSSTIKGHVRISEKFNTNDFILFQITEVAGQDTNAWYNLTVSEEASSAVSPFGDTDDIIVSFQVTGDLGQKGQKGQTGADSTVVGPKGTLGPKGQKGQGF